MYATKSTFPKLASASASCPLRVRFPLSSDLDEAMRCYAKGDESAFEILYELLEPRLAAFCERLCVQREDAEDVAQETWLRIHRARATYIPGAPTVPWAFAIARSIHRDRLRQAARRPEELVDPKEQASPLGRVASGSASPEATALHRDQLGVVRRALVDLSEPTRRAYVMSRVEENSVDETAAALSVSGDVVKQRVHRAGTFIREALAHSGAAAFSGPSEVRRPARSA